MNKTILQRLNKYWRLTEKNFSFACNFGIFLKSTIFDWTLLQAQKLTSFNQRILDVSFVLMALYSQVGHKKLIVYQFILTMVVLNYTFLKNGQGFLFAGFIQHFKPRIVCFYALGMLLLKETPKLPFPLTCFPFLFLLVIFLQPTHIAAIHI